LYILKKVRKNEYAIQMGFKRENKGIRGQVIMIISIEY